MNWTSAAKILRCSLAVLACAFVALPVRAETNAPPDHSGRYLIIVDTSAPMRRRAPAVQKAVENLLRSSMAAQLDAGDTIALWTFDEQLYAGKFPLQVWQPELTDVVASNILAHLKGQRYQAKTSNFDTVAPTLNRVVQGSYRLTVLLISDGNERISGTPFDRQIEGAFAEKFKAQEKDRMPFITVLRSMLGQYRNATVNLAPWPVEFPEFPPEPAVVEAPKPVPPEVKPAPRPLAPPLILTGKKPAAVTNQPPAQTNAAPVVPTNAAAVTEPVVPLIRPTPPQLSPAEIKPAPVPTPVPAETAPPSAPPPATNVVAISTNPPEVPPGVAASEPNPVAPSPAPPTNPPPSAALAIAPNPAPVVATNASVGETAPTNSPGPVALAMKPDPAFNRLGFWGIGVALLLLALGLFFVVRSRARHADGASLITRSMDRDHK